MLEVLTKSGAVIRAEVETEVQREALAFSISVFGGEVNRVEVNLDAEAEAL